jgi:hypothetical protein
VLDVGNLTHNHINVTFGLVCFVAQEWLKFLILMTGLVAPRDGRLAVWPEGGILCAESPPAPPDLLEAELLSPSAIKAWKISGMRLDVSNFERQSCSWLALQCPRPRRSEMNKDEERSSRGDSDRQSAREIVAESCEPLCELPFASQWQA